MTLLASGVGVGSGIGPAMTPRGRPRMARDLNLCIVAYSPPCLMLVLQSVVDKLGVGKVESAHHLIVGEERRMI